MISSVNAPIHVNPPPEYKISPGWHKRLVSSLHFEGLPGGIDRKMKLTHSDSTAYAAAVVLVVFVADARVDTLIA